MKRKLEQLYSQGKCRVEDLKLEGPMAQRLRRQQPGTPRYDAKTGWPIDELAAARESPPLAPTNEDLSVVSDLVPRPPREHQSATPGALPKHLREMLERQQRWKPKE